MKTFHQRIVSLSPRSAFRLHLNYLSCIDSTTYKGMPTKPYDSSPSMIEINAKLLKIAFVRYNLTLMVD
ncbi:CLUMA_CG009828, isoform A [Clunio marinus]|uniref:CLUMA_CG009828, isoform A n=1 Tax=Clunio marinus TaxID=568069 RepID=A0A1J1IA16_9DIPT|nr:CLUMA_CG009828, isoform A [Clunio marinus]